MNRTTRRYASAIVVLLLTPANRKPPVTAARPASPAPSLPHSPSRIAAIVSRPEKNAFRDRVSYLYDFLMGPGVSIRSAKALVTRRAGEPRLPYRQHRGESRHRSHAASDGG